MGERFGGWGVGLGGAVGRLSVGSQPSLGEPVALLAAELVIACREVCSGSSSFCKLLWVEDRLRKVLNIVPC